LLYPGLVVEDSYFFSRMLNNHNIKQIGFTYSGYRSIIPNSIIYLSLFAPFLPLSPYIMIIFCFLNSIAAYSIFALRRFRYFIDNDNIRYLICLTITLVPFGDYILQTNTVYSIWNSLFILILLISVPVSSSKLVTIFQTIISLLMIASHGMSFIIIPFCAYFLFTRPKLLDKIYNGILLLGVLSYIITSVHPIKSQMNLSPKSFIFSLQLLFERVFFEGFFGNILRIDLVKHYPYIPISIGIIIGLTLTGLIYRWRGYLPKPIVEQFIVIGFLIIGLTIIPTITRNLISQKELIMLEPWSSNRYFYIQHMLFIILILELFYFRLMKSSFTTQNHSNHTVIVKITISICVFWIIFLNINHQKIFFGTPIYNGREVIYFLSSLDKHMHNPEKAPQPIKLERGVWSIVYTGYSALPN